MRRGLHGERPAGVLEGQVQHRAGGRFDRCELHPRGVDVSGRPDVLQGLPAIGTGFRSSITVAARDPDRTTAREVLASVLKSPLPLKVELRPLTGEPHTESRRSVSVEAGATSRGPSCLRRLDHPGRPARAYLDLSEAGGLSTRRNRPAAGFARGAVSARRIAKSYSRLGGAGGEDIVAAGCVSIIFLS